MTTKAKVLTVSELVDELAQKTGLQKKDVKALLSALEEVTQKEIRAHRGIQIPGVVKVVVKATKARAAKMGRNPRTGEAMRIAAKPAGHAVKARPTKALNLLVKK